MNTLHKSEGYRKLIALYDATLARLTVPYQTQFIHTSYGRTHVVSAGSEGMEPVLILHGSASNAIGCWPLINGLASKYRLFAPDAPRQLGKTETFRLSTMNSDYGKWLAELLDKLNVERPRVVGFSFGGWMACKLAAHVPDRIEELVLLSPIGIAPFRLEYWLRAPALFLIMLLFRSDPSIRKFASLVAGKTASKEIIEELAVSARVFLNNFHKQGMPWQFSKKDLNKITTPTMLIVGRYDPFFDPERVVRRIRENLPKPQAEIVSGVGHVVYFEKPEFVNGRILEFFGSGH